MSRPLPPSSSRNRGLSSAERRRTPVRPGRAGRVLLATVLAAATLVAGPAAAQDAAASPEPTAEPSPAPPSTPPSPPATSPPAPALDPTLTPAPPPSTVTKPVKLRFNTWVDGGIVVGLGASVLSWGFIKAGFPNRTCTICDGPGTEVNGFDGAFRDAFVRRDIGPSATLSHVISYGISPLAGVAMAVGVAAADGRTSEAPANIVMILEASLVAVVVKEALTFAIRRERPQVHALEGDAKAKEIEEQSDPLESFPSGHVLSIMAITSSSAVIATMRKYRLAPVIWVVGSTIAGTVTYLRVAADQHYMSDNIIGAALGTGIGAAIPLLFHRPVKDGDHADARPTFPSGAMLTTTPVAGGRVVNVGWAF